MLSPILLMQIRTSKQVILVLLKIWQSKYPSVQQAELEAIYTVLLDIKGRWWLSIMVQGPTTAAGIVALSVILLQLVFAEMAAAKTLWWTAVNRKYEKTQRAILEVFNEILCTLSNILVLISFYSLCCGLWLTLCSWKLTAPHLQLMIWIPV